MKVKLTMQQVQLLNNLKVERRIGFNAAVAYVFDLAEQCITNTSIGRNDNEKDKIRQLEARGDSA